MNKFIRVRYTFFKVLSDSIHKTITLLGNFKEKSVRNM